jgi:hypothetical protein
MAELVCGIAIREFIQFIEHIEKGRHTAKRGGRSLNIVADGTPIGTIEVRGSGFARFRIVEFNVQVGQVPGAAEIEAKLDGGTSIAIHVSVGSWRGCVD